MARIIQPRPPTFRSNPPRGWHEQADGSLACPHRDLSVCDACAASTPEAHETYGRHFWIPDPADRRLLRQEKLRQQPKPSQVPAPISELDPVSGE